MNTATNMTGRFVVPEVVATHFHFREGERVADFGAGSGYFVPILSKLVGDEGKVFACEIQKNLVETVGEIVRTKNLSNVETLWCDIEEVGGTKIEDGALDHVIVVNTFFQVENQSETIKEVNRVLRSGGTLLLIDWSESFSGLGPQPDQVVDQSTAVSLCESVGFTLDRSFDAGDHHYGVALRKS